jgi:DUF4097 and DUF4098 domain-containing protein YvlB
MRTETFDTPGGLELSVEIPSGLVEVTAGDGPRAVLEIDGERRPGDVTVRLEPRATGHRLRVEHRGRRIGPFGGGELHVRASVPSGTDVELSTGSADLTIRGTLGAVAARAGSGDLAFDQTTGDVTVRTASGDVFGSRVGGALTMHGASGDLLVQEVAGDVTARTASGDIAIGRLVGGARVSTVAGEVKLGTVAAGTVDVRTVSGDVEVGVEPGARVYLDLATTSGEVSCELEMHEDAPRDERASDLELRIGSVSGDVVVRRARIAKA